MFGFKARRKGTDGTKRRKGIMNQEALAMDCAGKAGQRGEEEEK